MFFQCDSTVDLVVWKSVVALLVFRSAGSRNEAIKCKGGGENRVSGCHRFPPERRVLFKTDRRARIAFGGLASSVTGRQW